MSKLLKLRGMVMQSDQNPHEWVPAEQAEALAAELASQVAWKERYMRDLLEGAERIRELEAALRLIADAKDVRGCDEIARQALGLTAETVVKPKPKPDWHGSQSGDGYSCYTCGAFTLRLDDIASVEKDCTKCDSTNDQGTKHGG